MNPKLDTKENPHLKLPLKKIKEVDDKILFSPYGYWFHTNLPDKKNDRIKGDYYISNGEFKRWEGKRFRNITRQKITSQKYYLKHKEKIAEYSQKYYLKHTEKIAEYYSQKYYTNPEYKEKIAEYNKTRYRDGGGKEYNQKYQSRSEYKEKRNKRQRDRRKTDPLYKLSCNLRRRFGMVMRKYIKTGKNSSSFTYICCTIEFVYQHLESQFTDGMSWDNHGLGDDKWHIDHRRPCDSFDLTIEEEKYKCFHWTNLQPMWQSENISKSNKFNPETFTHEWKGREIGWVKNKENYLF